MIAASQVSAHARPKETDPGKHHHFSARHSSRERTAIRLSSGSEASEDVALCEDREPPTFAAGCVHNHCCLAPQACQIHILNNSSLRHETSLTSVRAFAAGSVRASLPRIANQHGPVTPGCAHNQLLPSSASLPNTYCQ